MKRFLIILLVLVLLAAAGLGIFVARFDADRYRPQVVAELEKATGQPVALQRISLGWHNGVALQLSGLVIADRTAPAQEPLLRVDQASAVVRLLPLLRREVQIASVVLTRPQVRVSRDAQGHINLIGMAVAGSPAAPVVGAPPQAGGAAMQVAIASVRVIDGQVRWVDALKSPVTEATLRDIDLTARNIVPGQPVSLDARLALLGTEQNIVFTGRIRPAAADRPGEMEAVRLELDLGRVRWDEAAQALPLLRHYGVKQVAGLLVVAVERLVLSPEGLAAAVASVRLSDGRKELAQFPQPIEEITLEATLAAARAEIKTARAQVGTGRLNFSGTIDGLGQPILRSTFKLTLEEMPLELFQPHPSPQDPYLRALCSATLQAAAAGAPEQLLSSLAGQGALRLREPVLVNLNVLREVFQKLSILPGLLQRLQSRLPEEYQQKFEARDTVFESLETKLRIEGGVIRFDRLPLRADTFALDSSGVVALQGGVNIRASLSIDPALSQALISSVNELQYLTDAEGRMQIPLVIQGQAPQIAVVPDVGDVGSRLLQTKVQDLIGNLLRKQLGPEETEAAPAEAPAAP